MEKNIKIEKPSANISGIIPRSDNQNNKASEVNQELLRMCKEANFDYIDHKNVNPRTHLKKVGYISIEICPL